MQRMKRFGTVAALVIAGLLGCESSATSPPVSTTPAESSAGDDHADHDGHADHHHPAEHGEAEEIAAMMAKLSPADRALAETQKVCAVSLEPLGTMGKPMKIAVAGREVFICCEGCETPLKDDPDKYLAQLDAHLAEQAATEPAAESSALAEESETP